MLTKSIGFVGGGRVTRILLGGWAKAGQTPREVVVSDSDSTALER
jgi:pyrroline-5-carboxylate reductase